jgi:hypothetical protein
VAESRIPIEPSPAESAAELAPARESRWQIAGRALRHRNFQLFFSGQLISLIGTWMQSVAQSWLVYRLTGSALLLGAVGFASQIPVFLFAPLGGITADRFNRRHIVIGTQVASMLLAFILAALTLLAQGPSLACICAGEFSGRGECVRHSWAAVVSGGHGRQGRLDECHRAEFFHVQWRARDRTSHRRDSGGEDRRRLVLLWKRRQLHRRDRRIAADAGAQPGPGVDGVSAGTHDGGIPFRQPYRTDPRPAAAVGVGESGGDALRGVDADFRRQDSARWSARIGHPDGRDWSGRTAGRPDPGVSARGEGPGAVGGAGAALASERVWLSLRSRTASGFLSFCCCRWVTQ